MHGINWDNSKQRPIELISAKETNKKLGILPKKKKIKIKIKKDQISKIL